MSSATREAGLEYRHTVVRDADECSQSLDGWQQHYQQLGRGSFVGELTQARWNDAALIRERTNRHVLQRMAAPPGGLVFGIAQTVAPGSQFDRRPLTTHTLLVLEGGREHELLAAGPIDMLGLQLGPSALAAWTAGAFAGIGHDRVCDGDSDHDSDHDSDDDIDCGIDALADAFADADADFGADAPAPRALQTAAARGCIALAPQTAEALRAELAHALAWARGSGERPLAPPRLARRVFARIAQACRPSDDGPAPPAPPLGSERSHRTLTLALDFMAAHLTDDIRIEDICRASHASPRLLHHSFRTHRRCSAHRSLLAMRLSHARQTLRRDPGQSITALAHDLRFCSSSHFAAQYRAMFGERPSALTR